MGSSDYLQITVGPLNKTADSKDKRMYMAFSNPHPGQDNLASVKSFCGTCSSISWARYTKGLVSEPRQLEFHKLFFYCLQTVYCLFLLSTNSLYCQNFILYTAKTILPNFPSHTRFLQYLVTSPATKGVTQYLVGYPPQYLVCPQDLRGPQYLVGPPVLSGSPNT